MTTTAPPPAVIAGFELEPGSIERLAGGHINASFGALRRDGTPCVLQRVNPIFPTRVNEDIEAVTRHLQAQGLMTPRLIRTREGGLWLEHEGRVWRCLTRVPGATRERVTAAAEAREAGRILGRFHAALAGFGQPLRNSRPGVHDLERHLGNLQRVLEARSAHEAHAEVARLASRIFDEAGALTALPDVPPRLVHGDPKISNVVFDAGRAVCLIDLDTIAHMPVALELGDALRSWCNTAAEDSPEAAFSVDWLKAALEGYESGAPGLLTQAERRAIPDATLGIALELAARFAADALEEAYFAWDRERFARASEHNLARARAQLALADSLGGWLATARALVTNP